MTFKEQAADAVSDFGGSWTFIFIFTAFCGTWVVCNLLSHPFDGYPFILLNLILSCLSVFQAPFILMSQNRAAEIDRKRAQDDYQVDLDNQAEIKLINKKIDLLMTRLS